MTGVPFPNVSAILVDADGRITPVWRSLIAKLWANQGGGSASLGALVAGNANQVFNVAPATAGTDAVPLAQANTLYAPIAGGQTQIFAVGNALPGTNNAIRRAQCEGLFIAFVGTGAAIQAVTVGISPYTYTATTGGTLAVTAGTVTGVTLTRAGVTAAVAVGNIPVRNGDAVAITYTAVPTVSFIPT